MSGGYFNYNQFNLNDIASEIANLIETNSSEELNEYGDVEGRNYSNSTIELFEETYWILRKAAILVHRIDYLVSGDDGESSFAKNVVEELNDLELLEKNNEIKKYY